MRIYRTLRHAITILKTAQEFPVFTRSILLTICNFSILRRFSKIYSIFTPSKSSRHRDLRLDSASAFALLKKKSGVPG